VKGRGAASKRNHEADQSPAEQDGTVTDVPPALQFQDTFRLSADGLAKVLGELEARIMRAIWTLADAASAREVHEVVAREHDVQLLTVITVLNNLVQKGLLERAKQDALLHYRARCSETEFLERASRRVVEGVLALGPELVAASFVDVLAKRNPDQLAALEKLIHQRLQEQAEQTQNGKPDTP
jgi:predicted transcriptional regulator